MVEAGNINGPTGGFGSATTIPFNLVAPSDATPESELRTERRMKIFGVTASELRSLTFVNTAMAALLALGTGCFGYFLGLKSSLAIAGTMPDATLAFMRVVEPSVMWLGVAFYFLATIAWVTRVGFVATIKRESDPEKRQTPHVKGRFRRAWEAILS